MCLWSICFIFQISLLLSLLHRLLLTILILYVLWLFLYCIGIFVSLHLQRHDIFKKRIDSHGNVIEVRQDGIGAPKVNGYYVILSCICLRVIMAPTCLLYFHDYPLPCVCSTLQLFVSVLMHGLDYDIGQWLP